jgi:endogenous inhibitor of DNA gyrase (YacG/DUF329 family)
MPTVVDCPICGKKVEWSEKNKFRPFCSERCKQIDLGCWASDSYRIGGAVSDEEAGTPGLDFPDQPTR